MRRAFYLITILAPPNKKMRKFFYFVAKNYLGLTNLETTLKQQAFGGGKIALNDQGLAKNYLLEQIADMPKYLN